MIYTCQFWLQIKRKYKGCTTYNRILELEKWWFNLSPNGIKTVWTQSRNWVILLSKKSYSLIENLCIEVKNRGLFTIKRTLARWWEKAINWFLYTCGPFWQGHFLSDVIGLENSFNFFIGQLQKKKYTIWGGCQSHLD